jgi:pimeloyl-ACP methyl ester carboxylesterase
LGPVPIVTTPDGARIALHDLGGSGPPLLMVHATGMHGRVWEPMAHALAPNFHCWSLDLRGHGDSTPPPDPPHDWTGFVRDILAVVDHLGLHDALAVGHSMGGASLLAAEATRPGTFAALHLYEPAVFQGTGDQGERTADSVAVASHRREVFDSFEAAEARYGSRLPLSCFTPEALHAYVAHGFEPLPDGTVRLKCRAAVEAGVFAGFPRSGIVDRLGEVTCSVFLASGGAADEGVDDGWAGDPPAKDHFSSLASHLPHSHVVVLPGLNHFGPMQAPDVLAGSVVACFSRLG